MGIQKAEVKYLIVATVFGIAWFMFGIPWLLSNNADSWSPYTQFLIFNLSIYVLYFFIFKSWAMGSSSSFKLALVMILPFIALSMISPGYFIDFNTGALIDNVPLAKAATDYNVGYFWSSLGFHGRTLVFLVYGLSFFVILWVASKINGNIVKKI